MEYNIYKNMLIVSLFSLAFLSFWSLDTFALAAEGTRASTKIETKDLDSKLIKKEGKKLSDAVSNVMKQFENQ